VVFQLSCSLGDKVSVLYPTRNILPPVNRPSRALKKLKLLSFLEIVLLQVQYVLVIIQRLRFLNSFIHELIKLNFSFNDLDRRCYETGPQGSRKPLEREGRQCRNCFSRVLPSR
jgi:hypothetical protein